MPSLVSIGQSAANLIFVDTEFTDLVHPELLSLGMVTADGHEHYAELDPDDPTSRETLERAGNFARENGVLEQWGRVLGASACVEVMGKQTGDWLLEQARRLCQPVFIAFDYVTDYELLEQLLRDVGRWTTVREVVRPLNVAELADHFESGLAAEYAYGALRRRGLERHHALADAHALRAACIATLTGKRVAL
jgi:hypothetical protein